MKKKLLSMIMAVACVAMMCGCGEDANKASEASQGESVTTQGSIVITDYNADDYVTLCEYKNVPISVPAMVEYAAEDIDIQTKMVYFGYVAETEGITDRPVELYDMVDIDYVGKKDGVAFDGGTAQNYKLLIGSGQFIDGFEEGLLGVMPGETVDLNLKFPEAYGSAELAGQEVVFTVTVNFIAQMHDEKVADIGVEGVTTVEGLRTYIEEALTVPAETEYNYNAGMAAMAYLMSNSQFKELPPAIVETNKQAYREYLDRLGAQAGMDGASYVASQNVGDYETIVTEGAENYTKEILIVLAVATKEGLLLTDEQLDTRLEEIATASGRTVDDLLATGVTREEYRESFMYEDVMNFLAQNASNTVAE